MKNFSFFAKASVAPDAGQLQEFIVSFDLGAARDRMTSFCAKYPNLTEKIQKMRSLVFGSEEAAKYANPEDVADFCISEILQLSVEHALANGKKICTDSGNNDILEFCSRKFKFEESALIGSISDEGKIRDGDILFFICAKSKSRHGFVEEGEKGAPYERFLDGAVTYYKLSAEQGHPVAQSNLGDYYDQTRRYRTAPEEISEVVRLYKLAADQGYAKAQYNLGDYYRFRNGAEAVRLYKLAAEQGHVEAQRELGRCYWRGHRVEKDSFPMLERDCSSAILWLARASISDAEAQKTILQVQEFSLDRSSNNAALSASEITEVILANSIREGIRGNRSSLIGDLVEVSESRLSSAEMLKIYSTLANIYGVDVAQSKSCQMIADSWAKKLGQEIKIEGEELKEIVVSSRDANTIQCQLPSGVGTKPVALISAAASAAISVLTPPFLKRTAVSEDPSLNTGLVSGEDLFQGRNAQLLSKLAFDGITESRQDPKTLNFKVTADARELPAATHPAASYSPPAFTTEEISLNPMFQGASEFPASATNVSSSAALKAEKSRDQERK